MRAAGPSIPVVWYEGREEDEWVASTRRAILTCRAWEGEMRGIAVRSGDVETEWCPHHRENLQVAHVVV